MEPDTPLYIWENNPIYEDTCPYCYQHGMGDPYGGVDCSHCGEHIPAHNVVLELPVGGAGFLTHCGCGWKYDELGPDEAKSLVGEHISKNFWDAFFDGLQMQGLTD